MIYQRTIQAVIEKAFFQNKIIILYGARQVGKTTLVKNIMAKYSDARYIDCDLLENRQALQVENKAQLESFLGNYKVVVIDEAQRVQNIGLNLKIIHNYLPKVQIIATGSSSFDLANQINEPLTGRAFDYFLLPLSLEELQTRYDVLELSAKLENFLRFGLYPEIVDQPMETAQRLLDTISSNYLYKDILEFESLKRPQQLLNILQLLALQVGNEVSYHEIAKQVGLSSATVQKYIDLLEKTFVIFKLRAFSRNLRKEISKSVKVYFWDLGIRNSLIKNYNQLQLRSDVGALWENFCLVERLKFNHNHQRSVNCYFWRTYEQQEIDYIEESGGQLRAFEFKWTRQKMKPKKQFLAAYSNASFKVINKENFIDILQE
ncbi:MAG: ATP-binding protein [bacterium]